MHAGMSDTSAARELDQEGEWNQPGNTLDLLDSID